jgi:hypothetical protein
MSFLAGMPPELGVHQITEALDVKLAFMELSDRYLPRQTSSFPQSAVVILETWGCSAIFDETWLPFAKAAD